MITQLRTSRPVARKEHRCAACNGAIPPGTPYRRSTNIYDQRVYDWIECEACDGLTGEVWSWTGMPDEGVTFEDFWEWAHENRVTPDAQAWLARSGCTCERCTGETS